MLFVKLRNAWTVAIVERFENDVAKLLTAFATCYNEIEKPR